jgi:hypothetical protein
VPLFDHQPAARLEKIPRSEQGRVADIKVGVESHFFDSGSFTLWTRAKKWAAENGKSEWDFYDTDEHWQYLFDYAAFVKKHRHAIDLHANVDVIGNPELTWRNQQYLENVHGLDPVPVVHYKTPPEKWLTHYVRRGHQTVAVGGLVGSLGTPAAEAWLDRCFRVVCQPPHRRPAVRVHGFGVTNFAVMRKFPWASVDSSSWTQIGAYGGVLIPPYRNGQFTFAEDPFQVKMSLDSPGVGEKGKHYLTLTAGEKLLVEAWLKLIGIPLGCAKAGKVISHGVLTRHSERKVANMEYYRRFAASLPKYPWAWTPPPERKGLGLL